jgi:hypothetical protein
VEGLKFALMVIAFPAGTTVPTTGKSGEVKYPLSSSTYVPYVDALLVTLV